MTYRARVMVVLKGLVAGAVAATSAAISMPASAQLGLPGLGLPELPIRLPQRDGLVFPCNWVETIHHERRNTGYPDTNANYQVSAMPILPPAGTVIKVSGVYPRTRYFTFSVYDGFRPGNLLDSLQDWQLRPRLNGQPVLPPNLLPGPRPNTGNFTYTWEMTLRFEHPPANNADRAPDTIYMGDDSIRYLGTSVPNVFGNKQLTLRTYLPDAGENEFGGAPLPVITYTMPDGTVIDSRNNPDQATCDRLDSGQNLLLAVFPQATVTGTGNIRFVPDTSIDSLHVYPNGGTNYMRGVAARINADMAIARIRAPISPDADPVNAQVRYTSLCQNQYSNTAVVDCLVDRELVAQPDGYAVIVISTAARRPARAQPAFGYNYLPWGPSNQALIYLRQILPNPLFVGNYDFAEDQPRAPLSETLGIWAPQLTYCNRQTFEANAEAGGAALIAACRANYRPFFNGPNLGN